MNQQPYLGRFVRFAPIVSILLALALPHEGLMAQSERPGPSRGGIGARLRDLFYGEAPPRPAPPPPRSQGRRYSLDQPAPASGYDEPAPAQRSPVPAPEPQRNSRPSAGTGNPEVPSNWRRADSPPAPQPERPVTKPNTPPTTTSNTRQPETKPSTSKERPSEKSSVVSNKPKTSPRQEMTTSTPPKTTPQRRESIIKPSTNTEVAKKPATSPSTAATTQPRNNPPVEKPTRSETPALKEQPQVASQEMKLPVETTPTNPRQEPVPQNPRQSEAPSKTGANEPKIGTKTAVPGRVKSPYPPFNELDVTGLPSGSLAMDPTTKKVFRIP